MTSSVAAPDAAPAALAPASSKCKVAAEKRLVYGLFVLPFNAFSKEELSGLEGRLLRYEEFLGGWDIFWSALGFGLSVLTKTAVVFDCGAAPALVAAERLMGLEQQSQAAAELKKENSQLRERLQDAERRTGDARERSAPKDGPSPQAGERGAKSSKGSKAPPLPRLRVGADSGGALDERQQFRYVLLFEKGTSKLGAAAIEKLDQAIERLRRAPSARILLIGHVEFPGGTDWKLRLAYDRARAVATYLERRGISGERLLVASLRGPGWPHSANRTRSDHSMFRTVSVVVLAE